MAEKEEKKRKTKMQITRQITAILMIVISGVFSGFYVGNVFLSSQIKRVDYSQFAEEDLLDDPLKVKEKAKGKTPTELTATEVFVLSNFNLKTSPMFVLSSEGLLKHMSTQTIYNYRYRYNGIQYSEEISKGNVKSIAEKMVVVDDTVKIYSGDATSKTTANWSTNFKQFDFTGFKKNWGVSPDEIIPYIVSSQTVVSQSEVKMVSVGRYELTLDLNVKNSVIRYVKKIKKLSDLNEEPTFIQLRVKAIVDSNFNFVSIITNEKYTFSYMGVRVTCEGYLNQSYDFKNPPKEIKN